MLIITGPGRCGTSLMAKFFKEIGADVRGKWNKISDAGYEDPAVFAVNRKLQKYFEEDLKDEKYLVQCMVDISNIRMGVVKDPVFSWCGGKILEAWAKYRDDFDVLYMFRDPREIVASRKRVFTDLRPQDAVVEKVWDEHIAFWKKVYETGVKCEQLLYPDILKYFCRVVVALECLGIDVSKYESVWNEIVDESKVHIKC